MSLIISTPPLKSPCDYNGTQADEYHCLSVTRELSGQRLDVVLASLLPEHSRSRLQTWIKGGRISKDDVVVLDTKLKVYEGDRLAVLAVLPQQALANAPENIPLAVIFEDEHILVVNKPAGLVVHPGSGNWCGTMLNALLAHFEPIEALPRAGIVHRLDKETSGLMVVAKTLIAQTDLVRQLQARTVKRHYMAVVRGAIASSGTVDAPIGRHPTQRIKMAVMQNGKSARTHYKLLERLEGASVVECSLETGRTHQIRVHMVHIGHPLVGDPVYGTRHSVLAGAKDFNRQALHAFSLGLIHPHTGESMQWSAPLPEDMSVLIEQLK